jgi:hypothetical protein
VAGAACACPAYAAASTRSWGPTALSLLAVLPTAPVSAPVWPSTPRRPPSLPRAASARRATRAPSARSPPAPRPRARSPPARAGASTAPASQRHLRLTTLTTPAPTATTRTWFCRPAPGAFSLCRVGSTPRHRKASRWRASVTPSRSATTARCARSSSLVGWRAAGVLRSRRPGRPSATLSCISCGPWHSRRCAPLATRARWSASARLRATSSLACAPSPQLWRVRSRHLAGTSWCPPRSPAPSRRPTWYVAR